MATASAPRTSRLDMRMTDAQHEEIACAAELKGMSLTQWALQNLLDAARRDVAEASVTRLSIEAFDQFNAALDADMPTEARSLLERKPVWE